MTSSKSLILTISTLALLIFTASASSCIRNVNGYLYDLCPFQKPITIVTYDDPKTTTYNISINQPQITSCRGDEKIWASSSQREPKYADDICKSYDRDPSFQMTNHHDDDPEFGLTIIYRASGAKFYLDILCDHNMAHSSDLRFTFDTKESNASYQVFFAYSYFGCPIRDPSGRLIRVQESFLGE